MKNRGQTTFSPRFIWAPRSAPLISSSGKGGLSPISMKRVLLLIGIFFSNGLAQGAPTETGFEMLDLCDPSVKTIGGEVISSGESEKALYCSGYVSGFIDGIVVAGPFRSGPNLLCLPRSGVNTEQVIRDYVKYLRERPERLHQSGRVLLYASLRNAFPCKQ